MKLQSYCALALAALTGIGTLSAADTLLSDNRREGWTSNLFGPEVARLSTRATLTPDTTGDYACRGELQNTIMREHGSALLDGLYGPGGEVQVFSEFGGGPDQAGWVVDLNAPYLITGATLWSQQTDRLGVERLDILLSDDGQNFVSAGTLDTAGIANPAPDMPAELVVTLQNPAIARYVRFQVKKVSGLSQMQLGEVAVWGRSITADMNVDALKPANRRPAVKAEADGILCGAVLLNWKEFAASSLPVQGWKLYTAAAPFERADAPGVTLVEEFPAAVTEKLIYPLEPETTYYYGVTAIYDSGEYPAVELLTHHTGKVLEAETVGDILAINHFIGGGGARFVTRDNAAAWEQVALDLLKDSPFHEVRWWRSIPDAVLEFYRRGIGLTTWMSDENIANGKALGIYKYESANEPEYNGMTPAKYLENQKVYYAKTHASHPANMVSAPASGITTDGIEWLAEFYRLGGKDYFDILDLHTYCKNTAEFRLPEGYPPGSPEAMFERMQVVRDLMKQYGDEDKPIICTEFGYSDCNVANPSGAMTPERKAAFLTRAALIHYVLGFKRLYVYSFWDEGDNPNYTEHSFGMVDYNMQKKPTFYAFQTLGRELGEAVLVGPMAGVASPFFGYVFRDRETEAVISVIWNGAGDYSGLFRTAPGTVRITEMTGDVREVKTAADGTFRAVFGPGPIYMNAAAAVELVKATPYEAAALGTGSVEMQLLKPVTVVAPGKPAPQIEAELNNTTGQARNVAVTLHAADGAVLAQREVALAAGARETVAFPVPESTELLRQLTLAISYSDDYASHSDERPVYVRVLSANDGQTHLTEARLGSYEGTVWILSDDVLEVTIDPARGGRILEMYDKRIASNQLTLDYQHLNNLQNIAFYYCLWDQVVAPNGAGISANAPYQAQAEGSDTLVMTGGAPDGLQLRKELTLDGKGKLAMRVRMTNAGAQPVKATYHLHPEYTVGGTGDNNTDVLWVPTEGQLVSYPFWTGLGIRRTSPWEAGYWIVEDKLANYQLRQDFSMENFVEPAIWFGIGSYNLELRSAPADLVLAPQQSWQGEFDWEFSFTK